MEPSHTLAEPSIQWVHGPNAPPVASASTVHSSNMKTPSLDTPLVIENQSLRQAPTHSSGSVPSSSTNLAPMANFAPAKEDPPCTQW